MFVRKKKNKSGVISVQIIDKSTGKYKVIKTIGSSSDANMVEHLIKEGEVLIENKIGQKKYIFLAIGILQNQSWIISSR